MQLCSILTVFSEKQVNAFPYVAGSLVRYTITQLILRVIGKDEVSLFSYIDNVLAHHFDMFQEDIKRLYEQNNNIF